MRRAELVRGTGVVVASFAMSQRRTMPVRAETQIPINPIDVIVARKFYGSRPASLYVEPIVEASSYYGVSQDLLPITSMAESGGGTAGRSWFGLPLSFKTREEEIWYVAKLISGNDPKNPAYKQARDEIQTLQIFNSGRIGGWNDPNYPGKYSFFKGQLLELRDRYSIVPEQQSSEPELVEESEVLDIAE